MPLPAILAALGRVGATAAAGGAAEGAAAGAGRAAGGLNAVSGALKQTGAAASQAGQKLNSATSIFEQAGGKIHAVISKIASVSTFFTDLMTGSATAIKAFADPIVSLTALSNPAALQQFTIAANDAFAVIGRTLLPVTQALTRVMRKLGDVYATFEPAITKVTQAVGDAIDDLLEVWADVASQAEPFIDLITSALVTVVKAVRDFGGVILIVVGWIGKAINSVLGLIGYGDKLKPRSSAGAAVRNVTITGSTEEYARKAQEEAFKNASASPEKRGKAQKTTIDLIYDFLSNNLSQDRIKQLIRTVYEEIRNQAGGKVPTTGDNPVISAGVGPIMSWILGARTS